MSANSFTIVFQVEDMEKFKEFSSKYIMNMGSDETVHGARVTAAGWCDAMTESDALRDHIEQQGSCSQYIIDCFMEDLR